MPRLKFNPYWFEVFLRTSDNVRIIASSPQQEVCPRRSYSRDRAAMGRRNRESNLSSLIVALR